MIHAKKAFLIFFVCGITTTSARTQTLTTLVNFAYTNGYQPVGPLIQGIDGNLYGVTAQGGNTIKCFFGCGTIFKISPEGALTVLHRFDDKDGLSPNGPLVQDGKGILYGSTYQGGVYDPSGVEHGTIFSITLNGKLTTLHNFSGTDGAGVTNLVGGTDGNLYGTTQYGGTAGLGTLFKITPDGVLTTLQDSILMNCLICGPDGNLYGCLGTTVVTISPAGLLTVLYTFDVADGYSPYSLLFGTDGDIYGTTFNSTVFQLSTAGALKTLYSFDGVSLNPSLIQGSDGNLYGTTTFGFPETVFQLTPAGALTTLATLSGSNEGPVGLVEDTSGVLYGTSSSGGVNLCPAYESDYYCGAVFSLSLSPGLGPFLKPRPAAGPVGTTIEILGTNLSGATSVTFNGAPSRFSVISPSFISAKVPVGATTGEIQVTVPAGTLSSDAAFHVRP